MRKDALFDRRRLYKIAHARLDCGRLRRILAPWAQSALRDFTRGVQEAAMGKNRKASFDPRMFLAKVGGGKSIAKYKKDQIVFSQGDVADAVFYVQEGKLKVTVISEQGKEAVVAILGPGDFFGEGSLNGHTLRVATTSAMAECVVTRIAKQSMTAKLAQKDVDARWTKKNDESFYGYKNHVGVDKAHKLTANGI
jgi:CRP-like cAMP-binding protein